VLAERAGQISITEKNIRLQLPLSPPHHHQHHYHLRVDCLVSTLPRVLRETLAVFSEHAHTPTPSKEGFSFFSSWEKEERQGGKKREAVDGKHRINVHLVL
jgi:hypothetical protein